MRILSNGVCNQSRVMSHVWSSQVSGTNPDACSEFPNNSPTIIPIFGSMATSFEIFAWFPICTRANFFPTFVDHTTSRCILICPLFLLRCFSTRDNFEALTRRTKL